VTERFRVVPAVYVLLRREFEVLLQLRKGTGFRDGYWAVGAAGHVEAGESVLAAGVREAREELDVGIREPDLEALCAMHRTEGTGRAVDERADFFFTCSRWTGRPRRVEEHKSADLRWFALDALPEPVVPHELAVLARLRAGAVPAVLTYGFG
jgi:8-oxo-dGTP diphosphatase